CSVQHDQQITEAPQQPLRDSGYPVLDIPARRLCRGSAGTDNILHADLPRQVRGREAATLASVKPDVVATGNIGCITQLATSLDVPIVHTVELLDWAYGGPVPRGLEGYKQFVSDVPEPEMPRMKRTLQDFLRA